MTFHLVQSIQFAPHIPRTRGSPWPDSIRLVSAQTSASSRSGELPPESPSGPKSHTLAKEAKVERNQSDGFYNSHGVEIGNLGPCEVDCKTDDVIFARLDAAVEWLAGNRDTIKGAPVPFIRATFGLSNLEAIEALKRGRALRDARAA